MTWSIQLPASLAAIIEAQPCSLGHELRLRGWGLCCKAVGTAVGPLGVLLCTGPPCMLLCVRVRRPTLCTVARTPAARQPGGRQRLWSFKPCWRSPSPAPHHASSSSHPAGGTSAPDRHCLCVRGAMCRQPLRWHCSCACVCVCHDASCSAHSRACWQHKVPCVVHFIVVPAIVCTLEVPSSSCSQHLWLPCCPMTSGRPCALHPCPPNLLKSQGRKDCLSMENLQATVSKKTLVWPEAC